MFNRLLLLLGLVGTLVSCEIKKTEADEKVQPVYELIERMPPGYADHFSTSIINNQMMDK
ncbi:hypothetical protein QQ008_12565 [Fulvivirgaceae bacterium BMA10]|uniref:Uncharacterized protein n=1 Tax=Splendidivirga corallicola TaxID=3051826 RepID=A0ABT8KN99_9BACT|nr:hypothetical protein [Fulvivirgaceae bacterium BMA10]